MSGKDMDEAFTLYDKVLEINPNNYPRMER